MKVAFLGLGRMGGAMAQNLAKAGLLDAVWNRSDGNAGWCADAGVRVATSPADAAGGADVVVLMLADGGVARSVGAEALAAHGGGLGARRHGHERARGGARARRRCAERGVGFVDAPVSGSIALATRGHADRARRRLRG